MRDKLIRLQKLYIDQFQRLQFLLKEERRSFRSGIENWSMIYVSTDNMMRIFLRRSSNDGNYFIQIIILYLV